MDEWKIGKDVEVLNTGAGPCLIVYCFDHTTREMVSGHFPVARISDDLDRQRVVNTQKRLLENNPKEIKIPNQL